MQRRLLTLGLCVVLGMSARADSPPRIAPWPMEVIQMNNGAVLKGLVLEMDERVVKFQCVHRHPGRPTVSFATVINRSEIARLERLPADQRSVLQAKLQDLEQNSPEGEKERMEGLGLGEIPWGKRAKGGWRYVSDYFVLTSDAPEEIVRRAALRLEQIYVAYSHYLPPRFQGAKPTSVLLINDLAEYQKRLAERKLPLLNPAYYDPQDNRIVCHSDLQAMGERLREVREYHKSIRADIDAKRAEVAKLYKGKELLRMGKPFDDARAMLDRADRLNDDRFVAATRQLFATLYHEAFHAYLGSFVYPERSGAPPQWLNEGLAQIFETAILDGGELRVGHAEPARLARAKDASAKGELVPLADLLRSGPKQFALVHVGDRQVSDRHYLTSWALAFHLTFERRLLGTTDMDRFVKRIAEGAEPREAFEELIKQPIAKFEPEFRKYLLYLQAAGNVVMPK